MSASAVSMQQGGGVQGYIYLHLLCLCSREEEYKVTYIYICCVYEAGRSTRLHTSTSAVSMQQGGGAQGYIYLHLLCLCSREEEHKVTYIYICCVYAAGRRSTRLHISTSAVSMQQGGGVQGYIYLHLLCLCSREEEYKVTYIYICCVYAAGRRSTRLHISTSAVSMQQGGGVQGYIYLHLLSAVYAAGRRSTRLHISTSAVSMQQGGGVQGYIYLHLLCLCSREEEYKVTYIYICCVYAAGRSSTRLHISTSAVSMKQGGGVQGYIYLHLLCLCSREEEYKVTYIYICCVYAAGRSSTRLHISTSAVSMQQGGGVQGYIYLHLLCLCSREEGGGEQGRLWRRFKRK